MRKIKFVSRILFLILSGGVLITIWGQGCTNGFKANEFVDHFSSTGVTSSAEFIAAKAILQDRCTNCHGTGKSQSASRMDFIQQTEFELAGWVVPGQPDQSKIIQRLHNFTGTSPIKNMPPTGPLPDAEYQTLRRWILSMSTQGPDANPYTCNDNDPLTNKMIAASVQALSPLQYSNTVKDFLNLVLPGNASAIYNKAIGSVSFPQDATSRYPRAVSDLSKDKLSAYFRAADQLATEITNAGNVNTFLTNIIALRPGACVSPSLVNLTTDCGLQAIRNLGLRLYRRPLIETPTNNEVELFREEFSISPDKAMALNNIVMRMMMSQNFLFRMEDQEIATPGQPKLLQLSSYAIANRLSYTFWNTMPDEELLRLADAGNLQDDIKFVEAMNYVLSAPKLDSSLKEFANGWLLLNKTPHFDPTTSSLSFFNDGITFNSAMRTAMNSEAEELVSYVARSSGRFADLFTTDISFTRYAPLMQVYGVSSPAPANITNQNAVRFPAGTRAGLLTRAALLAEATGGQNVIHRAVRIKRDLLCIPQAPPPADTTPPVPLTDAEFRSYTFRQRIAHNTGSGNCIGCHQTINPWAYGLSKYNGLGFFKQTEPAFTKDGQLTGAQLPLDSTTDLTNVIADGRMLNDAIEFSSFVSTRRETQTCFTKNYATYFLNREPNSNIEGCRLNKMYNILKSGTLLDALSSIATDVEFRHKKID